ncbi:MAG: sensor histidine kinase [Cyclobacteriaceae bacterium]
MCGFMTLFGCRPSVGDEDRVDVTPYLSYLVVYPDSVETSRILQGSLDDQFHPAKTHKPTFGFLHKDVWLRLDPAAYRQAPAEAFLQVGYPLLQHVSFFTRGPDGDWQESHQGYSISGGNTAYNPNFGLPLDNTPENLSPVFIRLRSAGSLRAPVSLRDTKLVREESAGESLLFGLYFGALIMMVLYNFFLYTALKDRNYLYYCLFIIFNILSQWTYSGYMHYKMPGLTDILWDTHLSTFVLATVLFGTLFTIYFLNARRYAYLLYKPLIILASVTGILTVLSPFMPYRAAMIATIIMLAVSPLLIWATSIVSLRNKNQSARYYFIGWTIFLLFSAALSLQAAQIIPDTAWLDHVVRVAAVLEALFLTLALADRIHLLRIRRIKTKSRLLQATREKEQMAREHNGRLEELVAKRTYQLEVKQQEIMRQSRTIAEQNHRLYEHSEQLEALVKKRTRALTDTNLELVKQNVRLEQYAYITSHNLRGPVANLMGVLNIFDRQNPGSKINGECIFHIDKATASLESVIKDLSRVLDLRSDEDQVYEMLELEPLIRKLLSYSQKQIIRHNIQVELNLESGLVIRTVPLYLYNVLYNLISNGIKYRASTRQPKLYISTRSYDDKLEICVEDNGLGIDLSKHENKLYGLYQRFHLHREGRGIGLHLVKTQMEILRGRIELESEPDRGSAFRLVFDNMLPLTESGGRQDMIQKKPR